MTDTNDNKGATPPAEDPSRKSNDDVGPGSPPAAPPTVIMDATEVADTAALSLVTVLIDRDANTRIPAQVYGYEVPIMLEIYGEDRIFVIEEEETEVDDFDVERAYDGLKTKYRKHEAALKTTYRSLQDFARTIGVRAPTTTGTASARDKQSMQKVRKPASKKAAAKKAAAKR